MKILESYIILKTGKEAKTLTANVKSSHLRKNAASQRKIRFDNNVSNLIDSNISKEVKEAKRKARADFQRNQRRTKRGLK